MMMPRLKLITPENVSTELGFVQRRSRVMVINSIRTGVFLVLLLSALVFQFAQPTFVNIDMLLPIYGLLAIGFLLNGLYFVAIEKVQMASWPVAMMFAFDVVLVSGLIYFTGNPHAFFVLLYLASIMLSGFLFQKTGALFLAGWSAVLFNGVLILGPDVEGANLFMAAVLNNVAFFSVAILSGMLSSQFESLGVELKARGQDIEVLQDFNEMIVENIASGLLTTDLNGNVTYANQAAHRILDRRRLSGLGLPDFFPTLWLELQNAAESPQVNSDDGSDSEAQQIHRVELGYRNTRDEKLVLEAITSPLRGRDRGAEGYLVLLQDLTEIKRFEDAMRQQEKLAAVGQLAAGIAHEIRNPLASISGSIQLLESALDVDTGEHQKLMRIILKEIDRLNLLISEFLEFVKPEARPGDPVDVNVVLSEVMDMIRFNKELRSDVEQKTLLKAQGVVLGNRDKLKQALLNIVINAYQAMEDIDSPQFTVQTRNDQDKLTIIMRDNGKGMDEENRRRIFEPFHTTKPRGTGLGLAITHKVLESHGAQVFVESEEGVGTTFTIELPISNEPDPEEMAQQKYA